MTTGSSACSSRHQAVEDVEHAALLELAVGRVGGGAGPHPHRRQDLVLPAGPDSRARLARPTNHPKASVLGFATTSRRPYPDTVRHFINKGGLIVPKKCVQMETSRPGFLDVSR